MTENKEQEEAMEIDEQNIIPVMSFIIEGSFLTKAVESYMKMVHELPEEIDLDFVSLIPHQDYSDVFEITCEYKNLKVH